MVPRWQAIGRFGFPLLILLLVALPLLVPSANIVERLVVPPVNWVIGVIASLAGIG
jgi:hypothetical protein